jgi:putative transposase
MVIRPISQTIASIEEIEATYRPGLLASVFEHLRTLGIGAEGREYVRQAAQAPSRRESSSARSMSGACPVEKMGVTIGFESRTLELPAILVMAHDKSVRAFFNQPSRITLTYRVNGRTRSYLQTPDFLGIRDSGVALIECRPLQAVVERAKKEPELFALVDGRWICPPAMRAAEAMGFTHEVWTEESFSTTQLKNYRLLEDYFGAATVVPGSDAAIPAIVDVLRTHGRRSIESLLAETRDVATIDHVYSAIARGIAACDLTDVPVSAHDLCHVYRDAATMRAFGQSSLTAREARAWTSSWALSVSPGTMLSWADVPWQIVNVGTGEITLLSHEDLHQTLPLAVFDSLVTSGKIQPLAEPVAKPECEPEIAAFIARASEKDLRCASLRLDRIGKYLSGSGRAPTGRTERRYLALYREAEAAYGNGFPGLIPGYSRCGNRSPRLLRDVLAIVLKRITSDFRDPANVRAKHVYGLIAADCKERALPSPSYSWFCRFIKKLPKHSTLKSRAGAKAAYGIEARVDAPANVDSVHTERPFERAHVDHTLVDVETIFSETSHNLGRVWLTLMVDHHSRRVLGFYLSYDPPSYRSVLMVMRDCVRRHGRLPDSMVVDGGKEFKSTWFAVACARYNVTVIYRPITKPRFGGQGERLFGTVNTNFIHYLTGNTQLRKNVRQMTEEVNPDRLAVWTLRDLNSALEKYLFEIYDQLDHSELLMAPRQKFEIGMRKHGVRSQRLIPYGPSFLVNTCPSTPKGEARVQADGVKINYIYYNHPLLARHLGSDVPVRYEPFDMSRAWAFVDRRWIPLQSRFAQTLRHRSEREIALATAEWRKRRSDVERTRLTDFKLVKFLQEIDQTETLLMERRRAAEERRKRLEAQEEPDEFGDGRESTDAFTAEDQIAEPNSQTRMHDVDSDALTSAFLGSADVNDLCETY